MSKRAFATLSLMTLFVAAPMFAESPIKATIPFNFRVGATLMPAGEYTVSYNIPNVVVIAREDRKAACVAITMAVQSAKAPEVGKLIFNSYGDSHFLSQIWNPGYDQGRELHKTKTEVEFAKNFGAGRLASVRVTAR